MNEQNPYQAPNADSNTVDEEQAAVSKMPRPLSVWVTLVLLWIVEIFFVVAVINGFYQEYAVGNGSGESGWLLAAHRAVNFVVRVVMVGIPALAIRGILRRTQIGRWMGVLSLLMIFGFAVLGHMRQQNAPGHIDYANDAERAGGETAQIVMIVGYLTLTYRYAFSRKAKAYFARSTDVSDFSEYRL